MIKSAKVSVRSALSVAALALCGVLAAPLSAATIRVNTTADNATPGDGLVTLREAITAANNHLITDLGDVGTGFDTITFTAPPFDTAQTITLTSLLPNLNSNLTIQGPAAGVTVSGVGQFQVFRVIVIAAPPAVVARGVVQIVAINISNMTIANGLARGSDGNGGAVVGGGGGGGAGMGGGLMVQGAPVTLTNVNFLNCSAQGGNGGAGGTGFAGQMGGNGSFGGGAPLGQPAGYSGGGFGGDGEINSGNGGIGGFGGGGGGGFHLNGNGGSSSLFGGVGGKSDSNAASAGGGGGAGLGGAVYLRSGSLTANSCTFTNSHALGGNPGAGNNNAFAPGGGQGAGGAIFIDTPATVTLNNCVLDTGNAKGTQANGGAIYSFGTLNLSGTTVKNFSLADLGNGAQNNGGGIYSLGPLTVLNSLFDSNKSGSDDSASGPFGSAIANASEGSSMSITGTTFINNVGSGRRGGAVFAGGTTNSINSCYFSNNIANASLASNGQGAGIVANGNVTLVNTTFFNNVATDGSSLLLEFGTVNATNCTFSENGASGIAFENGTLFLVNGIVDANFKNLNVQAPAGIGHAMNSLVRSLNAGDRSIADDGNNIVATTAQMLLAPPGNYGGPVKTIGLLPASPALDSGTSSGAPQTDARGVTRPQGPGVDMGAFESKGFTLAISGGNNQSAQVTKPFAQALAVTLTSADSVPVDGILITYTPPASGASSTLAPGNSVPISNGSAQVTATANSTPGTYNIPAATPGVAPVAFTLTNTDILPPVIISTMSSPNPAHPGNTVTLFVVAQDPQGLPLTYTFDYGDGATGSSNQHIYVAPGAYTATVTVSNGFKSASAPIPVNVTVLVGSNFRFLLHIVSHGTDNVTIHGTIHIPSNFVLAGKTFTLDIGGNVESFVLDDRGHATNADGRITVTVLKRGGTTESNEDSFQATFKNVHFADKLKQTPPLDAQGLPLTVRVQVTLDTIQLISVGTAKFRTNAAGFSGAASFPPRRSISGAP